MDRVADGGTSRASQSVEIPVNPGLVSSPFSMDPVKNAASYGTGTYTSGISERAVASQQPSLATPPKNERASLWATNVSSPKQLILAKRRRSRLVASCRVAVM